MLAVDPDLDVFEATALGYLDRLRERLDEDPSRAMAFSPDGFTALHFAAFFGKAEVARALLEAGAAVGVYSENDTPRQPLHSASGRHHGCAASLIAAAPDVNAGNAMTIRRSTRPPARLLTWS